MTPRATVSACATARTGAGVAEYYSAFPITAPAYNVIRIAGEHIRDRAARHLSGRLLDIGCGEKRKMLLVGEFVDEYVGLDHEECPHDRSKIDLFGTAYRIPAAAESFDCVLSTAVLEHLEEPAAALREARRVLKPGGVALYTAPLFWHLHEEPRDFFRYTKHGLRHLFETAGFELLEVTSLGGFWVTFATELNYYVQRFRRGPAAPFVDAFVAVANWLAPRLDRGRLRDEAFTWMYVVVARKPTAAASSPPRERRP
ncbi:MAG TPA: methyltransferase domain-containing protein [Longimicrobiales bacterium]